MGPCGRPEGLGIGFLYITALFFAPPARTRIFPHSAPPFQNGPRRLRRVHSLDSNGVGGARLGQ